MKQNGDIISFIRNKDYVMVNDNLGHGSFGKTVVLQDPFIEELFVAKKYEPESKEIQQEYFKNFLDEIKILYKLNHKNVVRIYNYYAYEEHFTGFILMEYINGIPIDMYFQQYCEGWEDTSIDEIFIQLIDGFSYIEQQGIIHRDIRPSNILVDKNGVVKIIDFGIGKLNAEPLDVVDSLVGDINRQDSNTLPDDYYIGVYTSKTDMFYLADMFSRLLSNPNNESELFFSYTHLLEKMQEKAPASRFESFAEVREAVNQQSFEQLDFTEEDKRIYRNFADPLYRTINSFLDEMRFVSDISFFIGKLELALRINTFEDVIQNNSDIINSIVSSRVDFNNTVPIDYDSVNNFLKWFKNASGQTRGLIFSNLISKLSMIDIELSSDSLPF